MKKHIEHLKKKSASGLKGFIERNEKLLPFFVATINILIKILEK